MIMIKVYFKQAWQLMKQNKLFSALYIGGTALPLICTTFFFVTLYVMTVPIYPEYKRNDTAYMTYAAVRSDGTYWMSSISSYALKEYIYGVENAELVSAQRSLWGEQEVSTPGGDILTINLKPTDAAFFDVYSFDFDEGTSFTKEDFEAGALKAVINTWLAGQIFGDSQAIGKDIIINDVTYRVVGVVKSGNAIHEMSYADAYIPYTSLPDYDSQGSEDMLGSYKAVFVTPDLKALQDEVAEIVRRYNSVDTTRILEIPNQPQAHIDKVLGDNVERAPSSVWDKILQFVPVILGLLLVPALNLSGMIAGRMNMRSRELAVRKAFGAGHRALLNQVLWENLLLTLIGGVIGLITTWILLATCTGSIWGKTLRLYKNAAAGDSLSWDMLFSPGIFGIVLLLCLILNIISALIPAWNSLRHPIVNSLK